MCIAQALAHGLRLFFSHLTQLPRAIPVPRDIIRGKFQSIAWCLGGTHLAALILDDEGSRVRIFELDRASADVRHVPSKIDSLNDVSCSTISFVAVFVHLCDALRWSAQFTCTYLMILRLHFSSVLV